MGLTGWYPFIRKKYEPVVLHPTTLNTIPNRRLLDVLGTCYRVIRDSYSYNPEDVAHGRLEKEISRFGSPQQLRIFIDGDQSLEKRATALERERIRTKALDRTTKSLETLETRVATGSRLRKRHFSDVRSGLASSFYWSKEHRMGFAQYMRDKGWIVIEAETEADVAIAVEAQDDDIVISADSDMLAYETIKTLWRPVSGGQALVYSIPVLLQSLGITRTQLTALAVVSKTTTTEILPHWDQRPTMALLKTFLEQVIVGNDPRDTVSAYLLEDKVKSKNKDMEKFHNALSVFVDRQQTKVGDSGSQSDIQVWYERLSARFEDVCAKHKESKKFQVQTTQSSPSRDTIDRLRVSRSFNRFRTVESPSGVSKELKPLQQQEEPSRIVSESTSAILDVEDAGHAALTRTRIPRHRPRYSFKKRTGLGHHEPPSAAKQLKWKPPKIIPKVANNPSTTSVAKKDTDKKAKAIPKERSTNSSRTVKQKYLKSLSWHHPTSSLEVGLLEPNTKRVFTDRPDLQQAVVDCIRDASTKAVDVKRQAQRLIGGFIETLKTRIENEVAEARDDVSEGETLSETKRLEIRRKAVTDDERVILEYLGGKVKPKEDGDGENSTDGSQQHSDDTDLDEKGDKQVHFLQSFLTYLYSNNLPNKNSEIGKAVDGFVAMLVKFGLFAVTRSRGEINQRTPFTPTHLVRSVVGNLAWELKNMYQGGSHLLHDKVSALKDKGRLGQDIVFCIQEDVSAVENYLALNEHIPNPWRIVPITSSKPAFVSFSELELGHFFWKSDPLRNRLIELASSDTGFLIKNFVCDIDPTGLSNRQRRKSGHRGAIHLRSMDQIGAHLRLIEATKPKDYNEKGYIPRGSIRCDGSRIQVLAFKVRERQDARFKRLPEEDLPPRLTSTVAGGDYFLQEIRNVIRTEEDIARLWPGKNVDNMKILTLDAGQACPIGAYAYLPNGLIETDKGKEKANQGAAMEGVITTNLEPSVDATSGPSSMPDVASSSSRAITADSTSVSAPSPAFDVAYTSAQEQATDPDPGGAPSSSSSSPVHFNLAIKQKAVYQPVFRFRRWLEHEKSLVPEGQDESIHSLESHLPPLRGHSASVIEYARELEEVEERLKTFYTGDHHRFNRSKWDMSRARHEEYQLMAERLLNIVGGSLGRRIEDNKEQDPILIGVGLGQFESNIKLSSLDSTFLAYFIRT
ncbi:hypothetical protein BGZ88_007373, partial [Linnemannia elongata]